MVFGGGAFGGGVKVMRVERCSRQDSCPSQRDTACPPAPAWCLPPCEDPVRRPSLTSHLGRACLRSADNKPAGTLILDFAGFGTVRNNHLCSESPQSAALSYSGPDREGAPQRPVLQHGGTEAQGLVPLSTRREVTQQVQALEAGLPGSWTPTSKTARSHQKNIWI